MRALLLVIIALLLFAWVAFSSAPAPAGKPRKLSPAEQQDSVTPGRRRGKG